MKACTLITLLVITVSQTIVSVSGDCYKMSGCRDPNTGIQHKENEVFTDVNENRGSCAKCTCQQTKQFVASCMVVSITPLRNSLRKAIYSKSQMLANFAMDSEVELTEEEAVNVNCEHEAIPKFDRETHILQFYFINYYFVTWESQCCTKTKAYGNVHPYCKITFNESCEPRAVLRDKPKRRCPMPLRKFLRG